MEAGDGGVYTPLLTQGEQVDVLERLDFVLRNIAELRKEVEELRNSLQHLATEIVGEVRYRHCPFLPFAAAARVCSVAGIESLTSKIQKVEKASLFSAGMVS